MRAVLGEQLPPQIAVLPRQSGYDLDRSSPHRDTYMGVDQVKQRGAMTT